MPMKKLIRPVDDRKVAGVCNGIAKYLNLDPTLVRILWALGSLISLGTGVLAYVICCLLIPGEDSP